jgi:ABC-type oligopeptide transport system substrate-binding subunit
MSSHSLRRLLLVAFSSLALAACSSSADVGQTPAADSGTPGDGATSDAPSGSTGFKTYVILGDSISDRGGEALTS